jgi:hypothetical protein
LRYPEIFRCEIIPWYEIDQNTRLSVSKCIRSLYNVAEMTEPITQIQIENNTDTANKNDPQQTIPDKILQALETAKLITQNPMQWNTKQVGLCAYFVDCYFAKSNPNNLWKIGEMMFNVKYLRQAKNRYLGNTNTSGKPKNYKIIDAILETYK